MSGKIPQQNPERYEEASEPSPAMSPKSPKGEKGILLFRQDASRGPAENKEMRRVAERLERRERDP